MPKRDLTKQDIGEFSPQKYADLKSFTMRQWHMVATQRRLLWWQTEWLEHKKLFRVDPEGVRAFLADPLGYTSSSSLCVLPNIRPIPDKYIGPIPTDPNGLDARSFGTLDGIPLGQVHHSVSDGRRLVHLEVDMDAPNEELMANFAQWIIFYRDAQQETTMGTMGAIRPSTKSIQQDWMDEKLIPYMDLQIAARFLRLNPSDALIRNELFPNLQDFQWESTKRRLKRLQKKFFESDSDAVLHQLDR